MLMMEGGNEGNKDREAMEQRPQRPCLFGMRQCYVMMVLLCWLMVMCLDSEGEGVRRGIAAGRLSG